MFKSFLLLILLLPAISSAETTSRGELRIESRVFANDDNRDTEDFGYGLAGRLEVDNSVGHLQNRVQVFSRVDQKDPTRQRLNIEELYSQYNLDSWSFYAGYKILNWSTAEAFHPTDVVNSRNFDGPVENAEKVGELMAGFEYISDHFNFNAFYMPTVVRPQLAGPSNRLSFIPSGIDVGEIQFVNNQGELVETKDAVQQWALRAQIPVDSWEFNFYWVHHFDRTDIRVATDNTFLPNLRFVPILSEVDHYAFAFQYVWESWIFKSENAYRDFKENVFIPTYNANLTRNDYGISSLALEYLWTHASGSDTTFIVEYQEIYGVDKSLRANINPFQKDVLFGVRHAFNDVNSRELFAGVIADMESSRNREILANISYQQRLSDVWKIKAFARYIDAQPSSPIDVTGMTALNNDHQFEINLSRFF